MVEAPKEVVDESSKEVQPDAKPQNPEPQQPAPTAGEVAASGKPKETPSIFNRKKQKEVDEEEQASIMEKRAKEFSEEELQAAWKQFGVEKKDAGDTDKLILNRSVSKGEAHKVIIHLASQLEVSFLEKLEVELIQFLRSTLENDHITLDRSITQEEESKKLYTSKDIFEHMVKENPSLKDLKDRLGLDFDY